MVCLKNDCGPGEEGWGEERLEGKETLETIIWMIVGRTRVKKIKKVKEGKAYWKKINLRKENRRSAWNNP